jgi:thymidine phosphorylase
LGSPLDLQAGIYLHKKLNDDVKKWEIIYTLYANDQSKIDLALDTLADQKIYEIK